MNHNVKWVSRILALLVVSVALFASGFSQANVGLNLNESPSLFGLIDEDPSFQGTVPPALRQSCVELVKKYERNGVIQAVVEKNVDGDTVRLNLNNNNERQYIRFLSMDTPETNYQGKTQGYWDEQAKEISRELIPAGTKIDVHLEMNAEVCDVYGRILGVVWDGKRNVNLEMVSRALAVNYCIYPNMDNCETLGRAAQENVDRKQGIYGDKSLELPYIWRRHVSNRRDTKYIGDMRTKAVYPPESFERVPIGYRVFFQKKSDIQYPFFVAQ